MKPFSPPPREKARRDDEAHRGLVEHARARRKIQVDLAHWFARIDASCHYLLEGCASINEYGRTVGYSSKEAREFTAAGKVMAVCPMAEDYVLDGSLTVSTLAIIAAYFLDPMMTPLDDDGRPWTHAAVLAWARLLPDRDLRQHVRQTERDLETGERTQRCTLNLTAQGALDLDRAQVLQSRKEKRLVSKSETVETAVHEFVEKHDPLEQAPGTRRVPEMPERTDGTRNPRYVPAEVRRALKKRHGDVCAIRYCENRIWLEHSHHTPHCEGGGNEVEDQHDICSTHHRMKDHDEIKWVPNPSEPGGGHYVTLRGRIIPLKPVARPDGLPPDPPSEPPRDDRCCDPPIVYTATRRTGVPVHSPRSSACLPLPTSPAAVAGLHVPAGTRASPRRSRPGGRRRASRSPTAALRP